MVAANGGSESIGGKCHRKETASEEIGGVGEKVSSLHQQVR